MTKRTFCEECRDDVEFTVASVPMTGTVKGKEYHYTGTETRCVNCGSLVFVPEISDANLRSLYDVFREENGIVPLDVICSIPEKYDIGKRPLSLLLGWGELTFSRYCDGDIPTRQYSDILRRIYAEPQYYADLLEENKGNLKSLRTYKKTRQAVDSLLSAGIPSDNKIHTVIQYLLNQCEDITPLALQKALYYIQGLYFAFYRTFLFPEDCEAWVHGPVYRDIYFRYRDYRFDPIKKTASFDTSVFTEGEKAICDSVINNICCYSGKVLECFTHKETPWLTARGNLPDSAPSDKIIEKSVIGAYFAAVKSRYHMSNPGDIKNYAEDMFHQL